jgi:hypothetical protein
MSRLRGAAIAGQIASGARNDMTIPMRQTSPTLSFAPKSTPAIIAISSAVDAMEATTETNVSKATSRDTAEERNFRFMTLGYRNACNTLHRGE